MNCCVMEAEAHANGDEEEDEEEVDGEGDGAMGQFWVPGGEEDEDGKPVMMSADEKRAARELRWQPAYYSLRSLLKVASTIPTLLFSEVCSALWPAVEVLLLHEHAWVRSSASRIVGHALALMTPSSLLEAMSGEGGGGGGGEEEEAAKKKRRKKSKGGGRRVAAAPLPRLPLERRRSLLRTFAVLVLYLPS